MVHVVLRESRTGLSKEVKKELVKVGKRMEMLEKRALTIKRPQARGPCVGVTTKLGNSEN